MLAEEPVTLTTPDGIILEAMVSAPGTTTSGVVICHPHPLYGGDMDNPVVVRAAEVAAVAGLATLRFNFRGVGRSTGTHGGGRAEQHDVAAALDHLATRLGDRSHVALAGYSFGAIMAADAAAARELAGLALIAPPLPFSQSRPLPRLGNARLPVLVVVGSNDEYCPLPALDRLRSELPNAEVRVIDGANHFFFGKLYPLGEALASWARQMSAGSEPGQSSRGRGAG